MQTTPSTQRRSKKHEGAVPPTSGVDVHSLRLCTEDARRAVLDADTGPADPTEYNSLLGRLLAARDKLPPLYRDTVYQPFTAALERLGPNGFVDVLLRDPSRTRTAGLIMDIAHAILQNGEGYNAIPTDAFQEVVSDLYDGFLSAEDRRGVKPPDKGVIAPLVKWGNPDSGPYTWPVDATSVFGVRAAVVNLPPSNARRGLLAWAALGHETAGHDILHADTGLQAELATALRSGLREAGMPQGLPEYWADRIDETASDVFGILNMGPAAAIGLIGYFRGIRAAYDGVEALSNQGSANDPHPADILRGFLASATVKLLSFSGAQAWSRVLQEETTKDLRTIALHGVPTSSDQARRSTEIVARILTRKAMVSLENHALGDIQDWRDTDERIVQALAPQMTNAGTLPSSAASGTYAAHVVAAAVMKAVSGGADIDQIFQRMLATLKLMHNENPSWGPLYIAHPGNLVRSFSYHRLEAPDELAQEASGQA